MIQSADKLPGAAEIEQFQQDGAIVLRGVFADWIEPLQRGIEAIMADPSPLERSYRPADGSAPFFQDFCNWSRVEEFRSFVFDSPAGAIAASRRRAFSARFVGDDAVYVDRLGKGSPPFADLDLKTGAPLEGPDFPVVFES